MRLTSSVGIIIIWSIQQTRDVILCSLKVREKPEIDECQMFGFTNKKLRAAVKMMT